MTKIGVLALQGCIEPHIQHLHRLGVSTVEVRRKADLEGIDGLILPGGESTTMLRLLQREDFFSSLSDFVSRTPTLGICAGAILLAKEVAHPQQASLEAINIRAERNAYGSQRESFQTEVVIEGVASPVLVDFIRAPKLIPLSESVSVLSRHGDDAVLVREGHIFCSAFHTELTENSVLHEMLLEVVRA